jgi:cellulose synthase/poly-beta-1,6-N-acetylglucosamine synthase-like glycosyltransferase
VGDREPVLAVVVCTHDRPRELERCLAALAGLQDPVEALVVDSASTEPVAPLVARFADRLAVRCVHEPVAGLSRARNRGAAETAHELVAFVDDDAMPAPDWAGRLASAFADPAVGCAGGTCRPAFECERPPWLSDRLLQFSGITRFGTEPRDAETSADFPFGANIAFRRTAFAEVGGFSERLGRIGASLLSGEEHAVVADLRTRGWRIRLQPDAVVDHLVPAARCRSSYYWRRLWWQGVSRARERRSASIAARLAAAAPVRLALWAATRDRVYLYRMAETAGYLADSLRPART